MKSLANLDVLILPIDGSSHILSYDNIAAIIAELRPRIVIPGHYYTKGASSVLTTLSDASDWVSRQPDAETLSSSRLSLSAEDVKNMTGTKVYYFGANFTTK